MTRRLAPAAAVLAAATLGLGGGSVGAATATAAPTTIPTTTTSADRQDTEPACPPERGKDDDGERDDKKPGIGDPQELEDSENEVRIAVVDVADQAEPEDPFFGPTQGNRLVAVQFCVENTGDNVFEDPLLDSQVIDTEGQGYDVAWLTPTDAGPEFPTDTIRVEPGDHALGFITYEVPQDAKLDKVRYVMPLPEFFDGDDSGTWDISEKERSEAEHL